jgi:hypothetical protein
MDPMDTEEKLAKQFKPRRWPYIVVFLIAAAAGGGLYYWSTLKPAPLLPPPVVEAGPDAQAPEPTVAPMPPVGDADDQVRRALAGVSPSPILATWLKTEDLARRFSSAVNSIADGASPRASLSFLAPTGHFEVAKKGSKTFIDPRCYSRYDFLGEVFGSIDVAAAGKAWTTLHPLLDSAYGEIGKPKTHLDERLATAIASLVATPVPSEPVEVTRPDLMYKFADPQLEGLSAASKHLLRTGPKNMRIIQGKLKELAAEMHLPPPAK